MKPERTIFQVVKTVGRKRVMIDGKKFRRQRTFRQNIDFFNVNEDGRPKTYDEVMASVRAEAEAWENDVH
jgi:hypothetical protein